MFPMKTLRSAVLIALATASIAAALPSNASAHGFGGPHFGAGHHFGAHFGGGYWGIRHGGWGYRHFVYGCPAYWSYGVCVRPLYGY